MTGARWVPSPNFDARPAAPDMIVLHYTDMADANAALRWLTTPQSRVSAHYLILADGALVQMVREEDRAWHAGVSSWQGVRDNNARAIGIELDSAGHRPDAPIFPAVQIDALLRLLGEIRGRWRIARRNVVAHSDIAPMRKIDPGERFPWLRLAREGHAIAVEAEPAAAMAPEALWRTMAKGGYGIPQNDAEAAALVRAFHRRHRPLQVEAAADGLTAGLAAAFADAVAAECRREEADAPREGVSSASDR